MSSLALRLASLFAVSTVSTPAAALMIATPLAALMIAAPGAAQEAANRIGVVAGYVTNDQNWNPAADVERVAGGLLGAWIDVRTPKPWLSVVAEAALTQRGSDIVTGGQVDGGVRTDYLTLGIRPRLSVGAGGVQAYVALGPTFDVLMRSRLDAGFAQVLDRERSPVFGATAAVGLSAQAGAGRSIGVEMRVFEGVGDAYSGDFVSVRNRSFELVARLGIVRPR